MNQETIEGNWNILKGKLKETYGELTDDDLREMEGRTDRAIGIIQRRTGLARQEIQRRLDELARE